MLHDSQERRTDGVRNAHQSSKNIQSAKRYADEPLTEWRAAGERNADAQPQRARGISALVIMVRERGGGYEWMARRFAKNAGSYHHHALWLQYQETEIALSICILKSHVQYGSWMERMRLMNDYYVVGGAVHVLVDSRNPNTTKKNTHTPIYKRIRRMNLL